MSSSELARSIKSSKNDAGPPSASQAIKVRQALIQRASLIRGSNASTSIEGQHKIDCWTFNTTESVFKRYESVDELKRDHEDARVVEFAKIDPGRPQSAQSLDQNKKDVLQGVRWFHTSGDNSDGVQTLGKMFGIKQEHCTDLSCDEWECEFVCGTSSTQDYLKVSVNELRFLNYIEEESTGLAVQRLNSASVKTTSRNQVADQSNDDLALEEIPLLIFFLPDLGVLISIGTPDRHGALLEAARLQLLNRRSVLFREYARGMTSPPLYHSGGDVQDAVGGEAGGRAAGCGSLLVVLMDALMDEIFPALDVFGDVIEGVQIMNDIKPSKANVQFAHRLAAHLHEIRRAVWDARGLFIELRQNNSGCLAAPHLLQIVLDSTHQIEREADSHTLLCRNVEYVYQQFQEARMNATLYSLTVATACFLPLQFLTGLWGMNFNPDMGNMPELNWEYGYVMFWCLVPVSALLGYLCIFCSSRVNSERQHVPTPS